MARIINTQLLGWVDMDHVLRVTPAEWEYNTRGEGGYIEARVYMMMRDNPFVVRSEWIKKEPGFGSVCVEADAFHEKWKHFLTEWMAK